MKTMPGTIILLFVSLLFLIGSVSLLITISLSLSLGIDDALLTGIIWFLIFFCLALVTHRLHVRLFPLAPGIYADRSAEEFHYQLQTLFVIVFFDPVLHRLPVPLPLTRLLHILLGASIGKNTYPSGAVLSHPYPMITIGHDCILGHGSVFSPHIMESGILGARPITVGDRVMIGVNAVILPGVTVGDDSIVAAGAVVPKDTVIPPNEVWGGVPAKKISERTPVPTPSAADDTSSL